MTDISEKGWRTLRRPLALDKQYVMLHCEKNGGHVLTPVSDLYVRPLQTGRYFGNLPGNEVREFDGDKG